MKKLVMVAFAVGMLAALSGCKWICPDCGDCDDCTPCSDCSDKTK
jgi:hypothetical protein